MHLIRFERACTAFEIRPEFWSTQLARLLQGRSLDVYQRLPAEEVDNYESLKTQLLKRFRLTEGGYRKKFKISKLEVGETPEQFVERLNRYLVKWCEMAGYDDDYDGLTRSRAAEIVKWGDSQEMAFNEIKHLLSSEPILKLPDLNKEFILQTDASNRSLGMSPPGT